MNTCFQNRTGRCGGVVIRGAAWIMILSMILQPVAAWAGTVTWDNGGGDAAWDTGLNWVGSPDNTKPSITDDAVFPTPLSGAADKTLGSGEKANSLTFNQTYTLGTGDLTLGTLGQSGASSVIVAASQTATINSTLAGSSGLAKVGTGTGTLTLGGVNLLTGGISISAGTLTMAATAAGDLALGNNPITLSGTGLLHIRASRTIYLREFSGSVGTIKGGYQTSAVLNALNDATFSGTFDQEGGGNLGTIGGFQKTGPATQRIESALALIMAGSPDIRRGELTLGGAAGRLQQGTSGALSVLMKGGTFTLDESTADHADRYPDGSAIHVYAGNSVLRYLGQSGTASSETVGSLNMGGYASGYPRHGGFLAVDVRPGGSGGTATLTFKDQLGSLDTNWDQPFNFANFTTTGTLGTNAKVMFTTTAPTLVNNVMKRSFANGTDIATYDNTLGVLPFTAYVTPTTDLNSPANTDTVLINASTTDTQLGGNATWNALKIDGARTIDLNNNTLTIGSATLASLIVKTGADEAEIKNTNGTKYLANLSAAFYVNEGTLKITAPLSSSNTHRVLKAGAGLLWLAPTADWINTGNLAGLGGAGIFFTDGAIRLNPDLNGVGTAGRFKNQTMVLSGGVMEIEGGITYNPTIGTGNANLTWRASGGFAAYGANATFQKNIAWNAADQLPDGAALLLN